MSVSVTIVTRGGCQTNRKMDRLQSVCPSHYSIDDQWLSSSSLSGHAVELPFVFHTLNIGNFTPTSEEMELAHNMTRYWTNFAHHGNPNDFYQVRSSHTIYKGTLDSTQRLPDWSSYYVDSKTGTKMSATMQFKTPRSQVRI